MTVGTDGLTVGDVPLEGTIRATYRFTDVFQQYHRTPPIPKNR